MCADAHQMPQQSSACTRGVTRQYQQGRKLPRLLDQRHQHTPKHHGASRVECCQGSRGNNSAGGVADGAQDRKRHIPISCNLRHRGALEIDGRASRRSPKHLFLGWLCNDPFATQQCMRGSAPEHPAQRRIGRKSPTARQHGVGHQQVARTQGRIEAASQAKA